MTPLLAVLLVFTAASGAAVALIRTPVHQVMAMAVNGLVLTLLFMALRAPDVAFAELTVGVAAVPLLFLVVLASIGMDRGGRGRDKLDREEPDGNGRGREGTL